jgi:hypothetical protein
MKIFITFCILLWAIFSTIENYDSCIQSSCNDMTTKTVNENCFNCIQCHSSYIFFRPLHFVLESKEKLNLGTFFVINLSEHTWHSLIFKPPIFLFS